MIARLLKVAATAAVAVIAWMFLWPLGLGGNASYVVVSGPSMEPAYHTGDLVIARKKPAYEVGDIVVYRTEYGDVIHRIIDGDGEDGYVLQGDNNDTIDQWLPTEADVLGEAWLHVPALGKYVLITKAVILTPPMPYLLAAFVFLVVVLGDDKKRPDGRAGDDGATDPDGEGGLDGPDGGLATLGTTASVDVTALGGNREADEVPVKVGASAR